MCDNVMRNLTLAFCAIERIWTLYTCDIYSMQCLLIDIHHNNKARVKQ